jgi:hypothetical protein
MAAPAAPPVFEDGVRMLLKRWTALNLALSHGWGAGRATADDLVADIIALFQDREAAPYKDEVEALLEDFLSEELHTIVEDNSASQIAAELLRLHDAHRRGDWAPYQALAQKAQQHAPATACVDAGGGAATPSDSED